MEIGPITGIRPVAMAPRTRSADDLSAVFQVEFRKQGGEETYSPSEEQGDGRFEEEEIELDASSDDSDADDHTTAPERRGSGISFFA